MNAWLLASRPKTLTAAIAPVLVGLAFAYKSPTFSPVYAAITLLAAILIQIGTNLCNDYYDFLKGADTHERVGPMRVTQAGLIPPERVRAAFILIFGLAALLGLALVIRAGWPILLIGILSIIAGTCYTAGPKPIAYVGLGEVFVLIFFGPVAVAGTVYVQTLEFNIRAVIAGIALGLLACAILTVNNLRDIHQDQKAGKKTLAVRFGAQFAHAEYVFCLLAPAFIAFQLGAYTSGVLIVLAMFRMRKSSLAELLPQTAMLLLLFAVLLSIEITQKSL